MSKPSIWYLPSPSHTEKVFGDGLYERFMENFNVTANPDETAYTVEEIEASIAEYDGVVSGWGTRPISDIALKNAQRLRIVAHSAGSVKYLFTDQGVADQLIPRDICVVSANRAIALNVAEHTVGALIAVSRQWANQAQHIRESGIWNEMSPPKHTAFLRGATVGLVSASTVGREVINLLQPFDVNILIYDPLLTDWEAGHLGVSKVELNDLFSRADMVSVHAPSIPETRHMIGLAQLELLRDGAVFINTSRGSVIDHDALYEAASTGRIHVHLDVTEPEPLPADHRLRFLENVMITPHTSGSGAFGYHQIGQIIMSALEEFFHGTVVAGRVRLDSWAQLA